MQSSIQIKLTKSVIIAIYNFLLCFVRPVDTAGSKCKRPTGQFSVPEDCTSFYNCYEVSGFLQLTVILMPECI